MGAQEDAPRVARLTQEICDGLLEEVRQRCERTPNPLKASAFILPEKHEKISEDIGAVMRSLASPHVQFFDVWSDPQHIELVAVGADNVVTHIVEQFRSVFQAAPTTRLEGHAEGIIPLPPWLKDGLYFKVLNVREEDPFRALGKFSDNDDPLVAFISTLYALGRERVCAWASFGWMEYDWWPWAREVSKSASQDIFSAIQSEAYQGPFYLEDTAKPTTGYRQSATQAEKRAQTTRLVATFRIALFAEDPARLEQAVRTMQGAVRAFAAENNVLHADPAPFEVAPRFEVTDLEALISMAHRELGEEDALKQLLNRHVEENVVRGRVGPLATPFPYLLINSDELALFVHLPVWATERRLTGLRYQKPPTPFIRLPTKPPRNVPWIAVGSAAEADVLEVPLGLDEFSIHVLFLGKTGTGKSTLIINNLLQIIQANQSLPPSERSTFWVIDPLGALGDAWKRCAPQAILEQTYFFDPEKTPWGMNMLELPPYSDDKERAKMVAVKIEAVTRMIKEAAKMISGQQQWGHRLETIIRQTLLALYSRPPTGQTPEPRDIPTFSELFSVVAAISDEEARARVADEMQLPNSIVTLFTDYDTQAQSAVYNKLLYFVEPHIESFTCSTKNNINFRELDKPGNIVFFNFKHFVVVPTTVATLMANVIVNIYLAELHSKTRLERGEAWQTYLVIDEFHRAADLASFHDILSTARNIKLSLWLAYQGIEQLTDEALSQTVFNNTHLKFIFSVGGDIAKHVKDQLDIALGKHIAERLQTLEMHQCYLSRTGNALVQTPPPILIRTLPPPKPLRSMSEADAFLAKKMAGFKPPVIERSFNVGPASTPKTDAEAAFDAFRRPDGTLQLPRPEDYPVLWAIRDFFFNGLETLSREANTVEMAPDFDELTQFINQQPWVVGNAKYRQRQFIFEAVNRLKRDGWIREASIGSMGKRAFILSSNPLRQAIVLFSIPQSGAANLGSREHLETIRAFMEAQTRKYMPNFMAYMPPEASDLADGIFVSNAGRNWNLKNPIAVEYHHHLQQESRWKRVIEQVKKRFQQGYAGIIVVCSTHDEERILRQKLEEDEELEPRLQASDIELYVWNTANREKALRPATP